MRSSLNESAVDYTFLAAQGVATSHVLTKLITPARLLADHLPGVRSIDYVNVDVESLVPPPLPPPTHSPTHPPPPCVLRAARGGGDVLRVVCHTLCDALCDAAAAQELAILRVWPFESVCVDVFNIENQPPHGEASILRPLQARRGAASG